MNIAGFKPLLLNAGGFCMRSAAWGFIESVPSGPWPGMLCIRVLIRRDSLASFHVVSWSHLGQAIEEIALVMSLNASEVTP